jgi:cell division protein FtsB
MAASDPMGDLTWWAKLAESSPVIVVLLVAGLVLGGRGGLAIVRELLARLDKKDEALAALRAEVVALNREILDALRDNTEAIKDLKDANDRARH